MPSSCPLCQKLQNLPVEDIVWQFPHSVALLGPFQYYTGYCVLVARQHATELSQLSPGQRHGYLDEMCQLAQAIEKVFHPDKLNYELLGNQVPHLHWHLFPRQANDPEALRPVWFALDRADHDHTEKKRLETGPFSRQEIRDRLHQELAKSPDPV
jgi:diadenosine tetraphosphate (Ap4A) HIT family hydrolase